MFDAVSRGNGANGSRVQRFTGKVKAPAAPVLYLRYHLFLLHKRMKLLEFTTVAVFKTMGRNLRPRLT